ncbi:tetratricopeptide repeat-containing sulfotransferase family protein [Halocynthiibacter namhaensis]|uniref:tetratricopeptide repeat-containing sulfotransferase family protein n=1 Tax=Halocynthiibacter namhaensis TaxID=1290553 RepID=UPI0005792F04|nr:tetratricopeptide repeat-containing sulfotransferase family protein [Halocynthiibacter namhaensis]
MLPINPQQIPTLYKQALVLKSKGDGDGARKLLNQIIVTRPQTAEAHFQLGELYLLALDFRRASGALATAAKLKPREGAIWTRWTEALIRLDDAATTTSALKQLAASGLPKNVQRQISARISSSAKSSKIDTGGIAPAKLQAIVAKLNTGNFSDAEALIRALLGKHPNVAVLYNMLATVLKDTNRLDDAISAAKRSTQLDRNYAEAWATLGDICLRHNRNQDAVQALEQARSLTPAAPGVLRNLAAAYFEQGQTRLALDTLEMALKHDPKSPDAFYLKARIQSDVQDHKAAMDNIQKARSAGMNTPAVINLEASTLNALNDAESAVALLDEALKAQPDTASFHRNRATILQSMGRFEEARDSLSAAIRLEPENGQNYRALSASHMFTQDDPLIDELKAVWARDTLKPDDRMQLGYALSKAMEDSKQYDQVFPYLNAASAIVRETHPYDIKIRRKEIDQVKKIFANFTPDDHPLTNHDEDYAPVFVTGMPRSGTTLVEQIIATHSTMTGAGELGRFSRSAFETSMMPTSPAHVDEVGAEKITALAEDYKTYINGILPEANQITDKSIQTYLLMGLVWLAMPKARIIVVRRDPRDNLLSIYKNLFSEARHLYSYDLEDLAAYYLMFDELIAFWRDIAPDRFYEVHYEDLISDPEAQSRALIEAAGLPWEDACLNFHQNKRRVDTLSVYQVRQPMYKSSMAAWKRYEADLQPLIDALGDHAT